MDINKLSELFFKYDSMAMKNEKAMYNPNSIFPEHSALNENDLEDKVPGFHIEK